MAFSHDYLFSDLPRSYNHKLIQAGQGTLGLDIMQSVPQADVVVVPISGGGLISGMAMAVKGVSPSTIVVERL